MTLVGGEDVVARAVHGAGALGGGLLELQVQLEKAFCS